MTLLVTTPSNSTYIYSSRMNMLGTIVAFEKEYEEVIPDLAVLLQCAQFICQLGNAKMVKDSFYVSVEMYEQLYHVMFCGREINNKIPS